jgi:hypothetical protein
VHRTDEASVADIFMVPVSGVGDSLYMYRLLVSQNHWGKDGTSCPVWASLSQRTRKSCHMALFRAKTYIYMILKMEAAYTSET